MAAEPEPLQSLQHIEAALPDAELIRRMLFLAVIDTIIYIFWIELGFSG